MNVKYIKYSQKYHCDLCNNLQELINNFTDILNKWSNKLKDRQE